MKAHHLIILLLLAAAGLGLTGCSSRKTSTRGSAGQVVKPRQPSRPAQDIFADEPSDALGRALVEEARQWIGTPYRYGGADRQGVDCSGLVMSVYRNVCNLKIPRTTRDQLMWASVVDRRKAHAGDLVFFSSDRTAEKVSHVGLYIGSGKMIHASSSRGVMVSAIDNGYWGERFCSIGRVSVKAPQIVGRAAPLPTACEPAPEAAKTQVATAKSSARPKAIAEIRYDQLPGAAPAQTSAIDLLDEMINQKVDSIFSNQYMD